MSVTILNKDWGTDDNLIEGDSSLGAVTYTGTISRTAGTLVGGQLVGAVDGYATVSPTLFGVGNLLGLPTERGSMRGGFVIDFETKFTIDLQPAAGNINIIGFPGLFTNEGVCIGSGTTKLIAYDDAGGTTTGATSLGTATQHIITVRRMEEWRPAMPDGETSVHILVWLNGALEITHRTAGAQGASSAATNFAIFYMGVSTAAKTTWKATWDDTWAILGRDPS
jgi:hypothetical protein